MSRDWFLQKERSSDFWLRTIRWIALHLGRPVARAFLIPITLYFLLFGERARTASKHYLTRVLGKKPSIAQQFRHIHCFAATILDRVFLLSGREKALDVRIHDADLLLDKIEHGQGCILLGAHLGSFEVLRALAVHQRELPLKVLMYADHNEMITRVLNVLSPEVAKTVIPLGRPDTLLRVKECLENGDMVGMLGDRVAESDKIQRCKLLGDEAEFPLGPMMLAAALQVPVVLFCGLYRGGNRYDIYFELLSDATAIKRSERENAVAKMTCHYANRLEFYLKKAPYNWFNFYDYWNEN